MKKQRKKKKFKITKGMLLRCSKGAISIFLCIIMAPCITTTLSIIEYYRYQEVMEVTNELYELTGLSALAEYDEYIHNRFGLLAMTQEKDVKKSAAQLFKENTQLLGTQVKVENVTIMGKLALSNEKVLKQQIMDFGELSVPMAILSEDLNLDQLIEKLSNLTDFSEMANTAQSLADAADSMAEAVEAAKDLKSSLDNLSTAVNKAKTTAQKLATDFGALINKLGEKGIKLPQNATEEEIAAAIDQFTSSEDGYIEDLQDIYKTAKQLVDEIKAVPGALSAIKGDVEKVKTEVQKAKDKISEIGSDSSKKGSEATEKAVNTIEDVLDDLTELVEGSLKDITSSTIEIAKEEVNKIKDSVLESVGLGSVVNRYSQIIKGDYFKTPLSDKAKEDLEDLLKAVGESYKEKNPNAVVEALKEKFVPNITGINIADIKQHVDDAVGGMQDAITENIKNGVIDLLTDLVNMAKGLFDLDVFYEADMNAWIADVDSSSSSSYQDFLDAIGLMFTAIDTLKNSMSEKGFSKIVKALKAIGQLFTSIKDLFIAIAETSTLMVQKLMDTVANFKNNGVKGLYEELVVSGYMRHNLPCRTDSGSVSSENGIVKLDLLNSGITGFAYNDIARQDKFNGQDPDSSVGFQGIAQVAKNLMNGSGTDRTFYGAELEYVLIGTNSEIANQIFTFLDLYFLRLLLSTPAVFMDGEVGTVAAAATIASWAVYIIYILVEPFLDCIALVNGADIPFVKTECWMTVSGFVKYAEIIADVCSDNAAVRDAINEKAGDFVSKNGGEPKSKEEGDDKDAFDADYKTHILILLLAKCKVEDQISRLSDIIYLEASEHYRSKGISFSKERMYSAVEIGSDVTFNPFFVLGEGTENGLFASDTKRMYSY